MQKQNKTKPNNTQNQKNNIKTLHFRIQIEIPETKTQSPKK